VKAIEEKLFQTRAKMSKSARGKIYTAETKMKISKANGKAIKVIDLETNLTSNYVSVRKAAEGAKKRISEFMSSENRPEGAGRAGQKIEVFDKETNLTATFDSFSAAATALDIRYGAIKNSFYKNQQKPYKGRYIFTKI